MVYKTILTLRKFGSQNSGTQGMSVRPLHCNARCREWAAVAVICMRRITKLMRRTASCAAAYVSHHTRVVSLWPNIDRPILRINSISMRCTIEHRTTPIYRRTLYRNSICQALRITRRSALLVRLHINRIRPTTPVDSYMVDVTFVPYKLQHILKYCRQWSRK